MTRKSNILLCAVASLALMLPAATAHAATPYAEETSTASITSVTPANLTDFVSGVDHLKDFDITFEGATAIEINEAKKPLFAMVSPTSAFPIDPSAANQSYLIDSISVTVTSGSSVRITVTSKAPYGSDDGISISPTTNQIAVKLPEGLFTVTCADGVARPNEATVYRYSFDSLHKINPEGISDYTTVTPSQLSNLTFPAGLAVNTPQQARTGYQLWYFPKGIGGARKVAGRYIITTGADGLVHAEYEGNYQHSSEEGTYYSGPISDLDEGLYYLAASNKMMFVNAQGAVQKSIWLTPVKLVKPSETAMRLGLAGDIYGSQYTGPRMPTFATSVDGAVSINTGSEVKATVEGWNYTLVAEDGVLRFPEAADLDLSSRYLNKGAISVSVTVPVGAINVTANDGANYTNDQTLSCSVTAVIENPLTVEQAVGTYYVKYFTGKAEGENFESGGWPVAVESAGADNLTVDNLFGASGPDVVSSGIMQATLNSRERTLLFPKQDVVYQGQTMTFAGTADSDGSFCATVDILGRIVMRSFTLSTDAEQPYINSTSMLLVKDNGVVPQSPEFTAEVGFDAAGKYVIKGSAKMPDCQITEFDVYNGDELVYVNRKVEGGNAIDFTIDASPVQGTVYNLRAVAVNCAQASEASVPVEVVYNPISIDDALGTYYLTSFSGTASDYDDHGTVLADAPGEFSYSGYDIDIYIDGEVTDGKCTVFIQGLRDGFEPAGKLDLITRRITFDMPEAYVISYLGLNPETGSYETYVTPFYLISDTNTSGDCAKNTPVTGYIDDYGVLRINPWELVLTWELYNMVYAHCDGITAVKSLGYAPAAPEMSISTLHSGDDMDVTGTVTVPTMSDNGMPLAPDVKAFSIKVTRKVSDGSVNVVCQEELLTAGQQVSFTDRIGMDKFTYSATAEYLGLASVTATDIEVDNISGAIADIAIGTVPADVYDLRGILIMRNATVTDLDALPSGFYIINGRKYCK